MIEIKKIFEEDSFDICGYYSDGHVDKEEFVNEDIEYIREDIEAGSISLTDEEEEEFLLLDTDVSKVEYVWYMEEDLGDDSFTTLFTFSSRDKEGYTKMTRYYR